MAVRMMFWGAFWAFLLDQASKYLVIHWMGLSQRQAIDVLPPLLNFRYGENTGINFGLFGGGDEAARWVLIALSLVICVALAVWINRSHQGARLMALAAGLVIGGALGNVADRLLYGYVLDFLNMSCCGITNPFVFNVADVFIFAGAAGLILFDRGGKNPA
ncbi:signal peptidase II [Phycobacter sp. K97]|uniref:signal peptidase II n=1 Tax=Phycobacter sedimenti TaxID=3133977 RepID=UPI00311F7587